MQTIERLKARDAAARLGLTTRTLETMRLRGLFTAQQDVPEGDRYYLSDEIEFWIEAIGTPEEREAALRKFRIKKKRLREPK